MKTIIIAVLLFAGGCIGAPFVLDESDPPPEVLIIETGPAEYPSSSAVVPAPLPPRSTRPAPVVAHAFDGGVRP